MNKNNFLSIPEYIELLKDKSTICVKDYKNHENGVIVRHDVDFSLELAYKFSRYELKHNIKSTYYILMTSNLYNVFSSESKKIILEMIKDGFEIGLHFDPTVYGNLQLNDLTEKMNYEVDMFERFYNTKIYSYSMHNPSLSGVYIEHNNLINAYNNEIFDDNSYISDSSFSFRNKNPFQFLKNSEKYKIQFVTHPIHFFCENMMSYKEQIKYIERIYSTKIHLSFKGNKHFEKENLDVIEC
jgi:hypothetical protein